jgi:hypothetical protein
MAARFAVPARSDADLAATLPELLRSLRPIQWFCSDATFQASELV